jgi:cell division protein FtsB
LTYRPGIAIYLSRIDARRKWRPTVLRRRVSNATGKEFCWHMAKSKKVFSDLQKQILTLRKETEDKYAEKAATEEEINRLSFTLSLYQAEKSVDEAVLEKVERLKERIAELEAQARQLPRAIRRLEAQQRRLKGADPSLR